MKKISKVVIAAIMAISFAQPVWARTCPKLIKEALTLLKKK